jgi:hypothetical protein
VDAELARFVTRGRHNAARLRSTDRHRHPAQFRIVALFDRCVEGVHVDMDDLAQYAGLGRSGFRALCRLTRRVHDGALSC